MAKPCRGQIARSKGETLILTQTAHGEPSTSRALMASKRTPHRRNAMARTVQNDGSARPLVRYQDPPSE
jgi:hypothetical protein